MKISRHIRKQRRQARRRILTLSHRAERMGMTLAGYLHFRTRSNLARFVNSAVFNFVIAVLIIYSIFLVFCEHSFLAGPRLERVVETSNALTWIFVVELSLRCVAAPSKRAFFSNYWLDLLALLPSLRVFRAMRALRLLRVLRAVRAIMILMRQSGWVSTRIARCLGDFGILLLVALMLIACGTLALLSADPAGGASSPFTTLLDRLWLTTFLFISGEFTTAVPATPEGKLAAALISVAGLVVFAIMVGTISASMTAYFRTKMDTKDVTLDELKGHLIICGWDRIGGSILSELEQVVDLWSRGVVVVAETDADIATEARVKNARRLFHVAQDYTKMEVLEAVGARRASCAIVLADKGHALRDQDRDARTVLAALTLEKLNPEMFTIAELLDEQNAGHLQIAGVEEIISRTDITAGLFASDVISHGVASVMRELLTHRQGNYLKKLPLPEECEGKRFIEIFDYFKREYEATVIGVERMEGTRRGRPQVNPPHDFVLRKHDILVAIVLRDSALCELSA